MIRTRAQVLLSQWLWLSIGVLVLNDHVLKAAYPGWVTGKLSDVAGVAMLALALSAMAGRRWPVAVVGIGFAALKIVPGVSELAAPLLGGMTLRDPWDLLALLVLVPVWRWLGSEAADRRIVTARLSIVAQLAVLCAVVGATSATSCGSGTGIAEVSYTDGRFAALLSDWSVNDRMAAWTSADGVQWTEADRVEGLGRRADLTTSVELADGTTFEVGQDGVDSTAPDGTKSTYRTERTSDYYCTDDPAAPYQSVATDGETVVAAMGEQGVSVRSTDGEWMVVAVGVPEPENSELERVAQRTAMVVGVLSFVAWFVVMALSRERSVAAAVMGGAGLLFLQFVSALIILQNAGPWPLFAWSVVSVTAWLSAIISLTISRRAPRFV